MHCVCQEQQTNNQHHSCRQCIDQQYSTENQYVSSCDKFFKARFDNILDQSYVEIDRIAFRENDEESSKYMSGESYFQKTKGCLFLSQFGHKNYKRMHHKKLQCQIGVGNTMTIQNLGSQRESKIRRLQILKIIKLVRLVLKEVRRIQKETKDLIVRQRELNRQLQEDMQLQLQALLQKFSIELNLKTMKINELEELLTGLQEENQQLREGETELRQNYEFLVARFEEQNVMNLNELDSIYSNSDMKIDELHDKNAQLQEQNGQLHREIHILNELISSSEVQIKKLQYENKQLNKQNIDLKADNQELICWEQQTQQIIQEECENITDNNEYLLKVVKLNQSYINELNYTKKEWKKAEQILEETKRDHEEIMAIQLNQMQQIFEKRIEIMKMQHQQELNSKSKYCEQIEQEQVNTHGLKRKQKKHQTMNLQMTMRSFKQNKCEVKTKKRQSRPSKLLQQNLKMQQSWTKLNGFSNKSAFSSVCHHN